ncbi:MAG TPA: SpoIIE family protein phosphatase [Terriglobia bacterium]|nr:SpoIIE family protein phosphatase [Terriglobia bacterium]
MFQSLLREYHSRFMARFTFWTILSWAVLRTVNAITKVVPLTLWVFVRIGVFVAAVYYLTRLIGLIRRRLLWRLTRRLAVTYIFIAFVPIVLILVLVALGGMIVSGQFAAFLVRGQLQNYVNELQHLSQLVAQEATLAQTQNPQILLNSLQHFCVTDLGRYEPSYPGLQITLRVSSQSRAFMPSGGTVKSPTSAPPWVAGKGFAGIVADDGVYALRAADREATAAGKLTLILSVPLTPALLDRAGGGIGPVAMLLTGPRRGTAQSGRTSRRSSVQVTTQGYKVTGGAITSDSLTVPLSQTWYDFPVFGLSAIHPIEWPAPSEHLRKEPIMVFVRSRIVPLDRQLLSTLGGVPNVPVYIFLVVGSVFLVIELIALIIGIFMTRTITSTVNRLQLATERVKAGDFSHRIGLPPRDQLSALGGAFDSMTASVERLLVESREKTRLEGELKIAREVQNQLFPRAAPEFPGVTLYGICRPARGVSGDYYDFLKLDQDRVGLVLGDVSGKGIFAALLMAAIQSAVHANLYDGHFPGNQFDGVSPASMVTRLNRQLYASTPEEKYATFFYAVYDARSHVLTYTNAGHPAPVLFRGESLLRLDSGGTVMGLFPSASYEQAQVRVQPGDVLLAFTDGLTEPENSYAEEFGEKRLIGAVRQDLDLRPEALMDEIYQRIADWTGSAEPQDDMTMLYLKTLR